MAAPDSTVFDVCVIGTGAGGGVMLDRLTAAGFRVVALERGPQLQTSQFDDDELANVVRDHSSRRSSSRPTGSTPRAPPKTVRFNHLAHCVGGTMTHWAPGRGAFGRTTSRALERAGAGGGSHSRGLADLLCGARALLPAGGDRFRGRGPGRREPVRGAAARDTRTRPHPPRTSSAVFAAAAAKLVTIPSRSPVAINSRPFAGRPALSYGGACRPTAASSMPRGRPSRSRFRARSRPKSWICARTPA